MRVSPRTAFTLIELVVVITLLGVVGAAMGMLLMRQQRFYRGASELLYAREGVRDAMEVLASDIRGIAVADTVRLMTDSAMEMFSNLGGSVVCQTTGGTDVALPPASPAGNTITSFSASPDSGDLALFLRDSVVAGSYWERHRVAAFAARPLATACPPSSGFSASQDIARGADGYLMTLQTPLTGAVRVGAPVRVIRRGRYSLYRASDGEWYLGYRRCNALGLSACGAIQPVSGPYRNYSRDPATTGLLFEYFDARGTRLDPGASPLALARVDVTARAESRHHLMIEGHGSTPADSATMSIAIRNRWP